MLSSVIGTDLIIIEDKIVFASVKGRIEANKFTGEGMNSIGKIIPDKKSIGIKINKEARIAVLWFFIISGINKPMQMKENEIKVKAINKSIEFIGSETLNRNTATSNTIIDSIKAKNSCPKIFPAIHVLCFVGELFSLK